MGRIFKKSKDTLCITSRIDGSEVKVLSFDPEDLAQSLVMGWYEEHECHQWPIDSIISDLEDSGIIEP